MLSWPIYQGRSEAVSSEWVQTGAARDKQSCHRWPLNHQTRPCSKHLWQIRRLSGASGSPIGESQHRPPGRRSKDMPSSLTSLLLLRSHSWLVTGPQQRLNTQTGDIMRPWDLSCPSWTACYLILQINNQHPVTKRKKHMQEARIRVKLLSRSWSHRSEGAVAGDTSEGYSNPSRPGPPGNIQSFSGWSVI